MDQFVKELEQSLQAIIQKLHDDLQTVRSNRPSVQLVENVRLECYGQPMTVKQVGSLSIRPPRDIEISVWDKSIVGAVTKAIQDANIGLSLSGDGSLIRASLPVLTNERREEFSKMAKKMAEQTHIQIRARRDEINKKVKTAEEEGASSEDQAFKGKEKIQKMVDDTNKRTDALLDAKLAELAE
ncbi:MAG: ribosome recycling factor [Candidatus Liptonbacteria bacterium]